MIERILLLVLTVLVTNTTMAQAATADHVDPKQVAQYLQAHPEHQSAFVEDGKGGIKCTDPQIRASVMKQSARVSPAFIPTHQTMTVVSEKKVQEPMRLSDAAQSMPKQTQSQGKADAARISELEALMSAGVAVDRELVREYKELVRRQSAP